MISFKNFIVENKPKGKDVLPDEPGHQTPGYYKGIKKKDKVARARHFARQGKMSDNDPSAYKKAPGDSEGPHGNKKSKHTLKVMKMYPSLYKDKKKTNESAVYNIKYKKYDYGTPESVKYMKQMTPGQQVKEVLDTPAKRNAYKKANQRSHYTAAQRMAKNYPGTSQEYKDKKFRDNELQRMKRIKGFMAVTKKSGTTGYEKEQTNEAANYSVSIEGLPRIFMTSDSPSKLKQELRKIIRKPDMIQSVKRITDADVKKSFRLKAQGKEEPEQTNEGSESWKAGYSRRVVKTTKPEHKEKGYNWRIKGKDRPEISIKLYKEKPSQSEFNKQMKRVAGHEFGG